jgi:hypothetical protein
VIEKALMMLPVMWTSTVESPLPIKFWTLSTDAPSKSLKKTRSFRGRTHQVTVASFAWAANAPLTLTFATINASIASFAAAFWDFVAQLVAVIAAAGDD